MQAFMDRMDKADYKFWASHNFCKRDRNGTIQARCPMKKREAIIAKDNEYEGNRNGAERAMKRTVIKSGLQKREDVLNGGDFCDMSKVAKRDTHGVEAVEKRNPFLIFAEIAMFAARMAGSLLSRVIPRVATYSPRLANLLKKSPGHLFKLAPKGQGANAGSREAMKQAFRKLADHKAFRKCIKDGKP